MGLGITYLVIIRLSLANELHYLGHIPGIEVRHIRGRLNRIQKRARLRGQQQMLHNQCHKRNIIVLGVAPPAVVDDAKVIYDD